MTPAEIKKHTKGLWDRIQAMVGKAILAAVQDSGNIQVVKVSGLADETQDGVERVQNYGVTSVPPEGGEVVLVFVGGNREHPVAIAADHGKSRPKGLKPGEVCLYSKHGQAVYLTEDGAVEFRTGGNGSTLPTTVVATFDKDGKLLLGGDTLAATAGVVTGECLDPVTGVPFPDKSAIVLARKV